MKIRRAGHASHRQLARANQRRVAREQLEAYLEAVYGRAPEGFVVASFRCQHAAREGYEDCPRPASDGWGEESFCWPADRQRLVMIVLQMREDHDVYLCPYVLGSARRTKGSALARDKIHADIDGVLDLTRLQELGGYAVGSGTPGHAHVYVDLDRSVTVDEHELLCRALGRFLGDADSKISDNDLLRPPGTLNHKTDPARPVTWARETTGRRWVLEDLAVALGADALGRPGGGHPRTSGGGLDAGLVDDSGSTASAASTGGRTGALQDSGEGGSYGPRRAYSPSRKTCSAPLLPPAALSPRLMRMLRKGQSTDERYHAQGRFDRSRARQALATGAVRAGWTEDEYLRALTTRSNLASRWYSEDRHGRPRAPEPLIRDDFRAAQEHVANNPAITDRDDCRKLLARIGAAAADARWPGAGGARDRHVLLECIKQADLRGTFTLQISGREVADAAGVSRSSAERALTSLVDAGWLHRIRRGDRRGRAAEYGFEVPAGVPSQSPARLVPQRPMNDYWSWAGPIRMRVFEATQKLVDGTEDQVAGHADVHVRTARDHLKRLAQAGLVRSDTEGRWTAVSDEEEAVLTQQLSEEPAVRGRLEKQRRRHQAQRLARGARTAPEVMSRLLEGMDPVERERYLASNPNLAAAHPQTPPLSAPTSVRPPPTRASARDGGDAD